MLRTARLLRPRGLRWHSTAEISKLRGVWEHDSDPIEVGKALSTEMTTLPFAYRRESEAFGQLVKGHHHEVHELNESKVRVIEREELMNCETVETVREPMKRLHDNTVQGRVNRDQIKIPERISKSIYNHMLALRLPKVLRYQVAQKYLELNKTQVYAPTRKAHENDIHIAAFFTQDYAAAHQVLSELKKRMPEFRPKKVLDVGYGPATGMLALNEVMGAEFRPDVKDAVIVGHHGMQNRAKVLLSRQLNEYPGALEELFTEEEMKEGVMKDEDVLFDDFIGEVKTNGIKTKTKLSDAVNPNKKYDLIIAQHQLLTDTVRFPYEVDSNVDVLLKCLEPEGVLVLVERGTPLGFETIARARQVMIRPEKYETESGKIPRPYYKGSSVKPGKMDLGLMEEMDEEFGEVAAEDLEFEDELFEEYEMSSEEVAKPDYHVSIVAPCSHHKKCPLQTLNPQYYDYPSGKKLNWCKYEKSVERPRFLLELKRGQVLSSKWDRKDEITPSKGSGGSGRKDANNYELTKYSYLIAQRSKNDCVSIDAIEQRRQENDEKTKHWPRILMNPLKRKGHVTMALCGSEGEIEKWTVTKSFDKLAYHDARKAHAGDLWGLDAKTKQVWMSNQDPGLRQKLENYEKELLLKQKKDRRLRDKSERKKFEVQAGAMMQKPQETPEEMIDFYTAKFNMSKRQRQLDKKAGIGHMT